MPTYQYACTACEDQFEIVQKFTDDALTECPHCGGRLRKVFSAVGVVFKGSGFYRTDSRSGSSSTVPAGESAGSTSSSGSDASSGSSSGSSDGGSGSAKPAPAPAASSTPASGSGSGSSSS